MLRMNLIGILYIQVLYTGVPFFKGLQINVYPHFKLFSTNKVSSQTQYIFQSMISHFSHKSLFFKCSPPFLAHQYTISNQTNFHYSIHPYLKYFTLPHFNYSLTTFSYLQTSDEAY